MHKLPSWNLLLILGALSLVLARPAVAEDEAQSEESLREQLSGTYELAPGKKQARQTIDRAIDEVVSEMSFIKRPFARSRLTDKTRPCSTLEITLSDEKMAIRCDQLPPAISPSDRTSVRYEAADGSRYQLRQEHSGRTLEQMFASKAGTRTNRFELDEDGETLRMNVTIISDQLPRTLTYSLTFEKK